jgi:N-acyl-D-aspartate/D-glutamate deacylase
MYDTIIRGGTIFDGLGSAPRTADIAIEDGRIAEIGQVRSPAREVIDADGAVVTPGFIDVHTHYDGQLLWDDQMDPSFSHGVTTIIAGNCGLGFAPVKDDHREQLIELMSGVEDIPDAVLDEGLDWSWSSFPDYLDQLGRRAYGLDAAVQIAHAPMRLFVMGDRALRHERATPEDVAAMAGLVRSGMAAGAVGVTSGRFVEHRSTKGDQVPGTFAGDDELLALARAMGEAGRGVFQVIPRGAVGALLSQGGGREDHLQEHALMEKIAEVSGQSVTYGAFEFPSDPEDFQIMIEESARAVSRGHAVHPQVSPRSVSQINLLEGYHAFMLKPSYLEIAHLPLKARVEALRDPARRAAILAEANGQLDRAKDPMGLIYQIQKDLPDAFILRSPLDFEPGPERRIGALAAAAGVTPEEYIYDHYTAGEGDNFNVTFALNYVHRDLETTAVAMTHPHVLSGGADGGAHMKIICDASMPTFQLAFWSRERTRGERLPLELMVNKLTGAPARLYGFKDRGVLEVGRRADINVIDYETLSVKMPYMTYDLPSGGARLLQASVGYLATYVAGVRTRDHDEDTGARPGRLLRGSA